MTGEYALPIRLCRSFKKNSTKLKKSSKRNKILLKKLFKSNNIFLCVLEEIMTQNFECRKGGHNISNKPHSADQ